MCDGVWALFDYHDLDSLWYDRDELLDYMEEQRWLSNPRYHFTWIRIER